MPIPFWDDAPEAWDTLSLGGTTMPGLASISGRVARKMDTRSRAGADGATVRDRGYEPAQIDIHVKVWTREQLTELRSVIDVIHPRNVTQATTSNQARSERDLERAQQILSGSAGASAGAADAFAGASAEVERLEAQVATERARPRPRGTRAPLDIAHPATELLGIRRVYVTEISIPELRGGEFITTIRAIEWTEAPRAAPPPASNSVGGGLDDQPTAYDDDRAARRPNAAPPARVT